MPLEVWMLFCDLLYHTCTRRNNNQATVQWQLVSEMNFTISYERDISRWTIFLFPWHETKNTKEKILLCTTILHNTTKDFVLIQCFPPTPRQRSNPIKQKGNRNNSGPNLQHLFSPFQKGIRISNSVSTEFIRIDVFPDNHCRRIRRRIYIFSTRNLKFLGKRRWRTTTKYVYTKVYDTVKGFFARSNLTYPRRQNMSHGWERELWDTAWF